MKKRVTFFIFVAIVTIVLSLVIGWQLVIKEVNFAVPFDGIASPQVGLFFLLRNCRLKFPQLSLSAEVLSVDATARTLTVDWFPIVRSCDSVIDIFFDP